MKGSISIAYLILARQLNCFIAMFWRLLYNVSDMYVSISQFIGDSLISSNCIRHWIDSATSCCKIIIYVFVMLLYTILFLI